ncbi:hypothetical protein [Halovivax limisalsi]|uniref:hypothetical protein n=1 Tax=Halovivax limisalsi TaxID=1453760 RepID=UPI001FFDB07A|nr:hypothetical protein [Halovivax limisalsi]
MQSNDNTSLEDGDAEEITPPWPINLQLTGEVNGVDVTVRGEGRIRTEGVYEVTLNFDRIPSGLHPSIVATYGVSCCCSAQASTRNGAKNMIDMGATEYVATRVLSMGDDELTIEGNSLAREECLELDLEIGGTVDLPEDMPGHSAYYVRLEPDGEDRLVGSGAATLYRESGEPLTAGVDSTYDLHPADVPNPVSEPQYRVVTEDGELDGNTYNTRIHSLLEGEDPIALLGDREPKFA